LANAPAASRISLPSIRNGIIDEELLQRTLSPLIVHLRSSENYARIYWDDLIQRREESWGYLPAFEAYINESYLSD
jgi:hypothetical protein